MSRPRPQPRTPLYFAYGSNLDPAQLQRRCSGARFVCRAQLEHHRLDFTRWSPLRGCGVADVVASHGEHVEGACFALSPAHIATLDELEGHLPGVDAYGRVLVEVVTLPTGERREAFTYRVRNPVPFTPPSRAYLEHILRGALHWGLPQAWLERLACIPTTERVGL